MPNRPSSNPGLDRQIEKKAGKSKLAPPNTVKVKRTKRGSK